MENPCHLGFFILGFSCSHTHTAHSTQPRRQTNLIELGKKKFQSVSSMHSRLSALLLKSPQKGLVPSLLAVGSRLIVSSSAATATMGSSRRFSNTCLGGGGGGGGAPIHEHDHVSFNQFPGIMVPGTVKKSETRRFQQFNPNSGFFVDNCNSLPVPHGYACHGSAYGWLFLVGDELDTKLMNPFTGEEIQLPSVKTLPRASYGWLGINKLYVLKAVFSSDPSLQPAPLVLVIHRGDTPRLAYCKPGDISWSSLHHAHIRHFYDDAIFYNDQFYAISQPGYIMAYDIKRRTDDNDHSVEKTLIASGPKGSKGDLYLVALDGKLIKLTRVILRSEDGYVTTRFIIRRFVASENKWVKVESLGDHALFLGKNTSFSLRASEHPGCIPNAIYFTDCNIRQNQEYGSDMGVYKLSDQSITPLYPIGSGLTLPPPVFVTRLDMFRAADIPILFSGRQSLFASSSASHSSGETPQQELKKKEKKCQIKSSKLQSRERSCDETYSTKVSLNQFPGLMVSGMVENSKTRRLLRVNHHTGYFEHEEDVADHSHRSELQVPHGHVCRGSAYGWLFLTDDNLDMKLLNPFSGAEIQLPPVKTLPASEAEEDERWPLSQWYVYKAFFSANPSVEPRPVVLVIYTEQFTHKLAFCKPGDKGWTPLEFPIKRHFNFKRGHVIHKDAVYHNGQFYVLSHPGYVAAFDIGRCIDDDDLSVKTTLVATAAKRELIYGRDWYLVVLDGELVRFEFKKACFDDCCIEGAKKRMEKERIRDGDTTDEYSTDEDYDVNFVDAEEDSETEIETGFEDDDFGIKELTMSSTICGSVKLNVTIPIPKVDFYSLNTPSCCFFNNRPSHTFGIKIRRFDESEQKWVKVESLGDKAVFLGYNTSFALSASDYPAGHCIPDSIYFSYGGSGNARTEMVSYDIGIYSVKDKIVKPLYPPMPMDDDDASQFVKPAPIWIVNSADRV